MMTQTLVLIILMMGFGTVGAMFFIMWPLLFWPVKTNIYSEVDGGLRLRTDVGKYVPDKVFGRVVKFYKNKDFTTNKKKILEKFKDSDFIIRGSFLPKKHLNVFEKSDGSWHIIKFQSNKDDPLLKLDLRDIMPTYVAEQQDTIQSTQQKNWFTSPIVIIGIVGVFVLVISIVGLQSYTSQVDKAVAKREALAMNPRGFCTEYFAPYGVTSNTSPEKLNSIEGGKPVEAGLPGVPFI